MDLESTYEDIAGTIDHALLGPAVTDEQLEGGCRLAVEYRVAAVCVKPYQLKRAVELLSGSAVEPTITIGFPHGGHTTGVKVAEAREAAGDGATELDMVVNVGKVLSGDWAFVRAEIAEVVRVGHDAGALVKVIFENCYLDDEHKIALCAICGEVGADFVKTSTGYGRGGATDDDVALMREHSPAHVAVKAAGGVRDLDRLLALRALGATRIGTSATAAILDECRRRLDL